MEILLKIRDNVYSEPNKAGKRKLLKKNVIIRNSFDLENIIGIGEVVNDKGEVLKNYTKVNLKELGPIVVYHKFDELRRLIHPDKQIGFK